MNRLKDQVVVVTGASSGIGRATALAFARKGAAVVATARRGDLLEALADECRAAGAPAALAVAVDVTEADAVEDLAREAAGRFGRIDVWVNNAAVHLFGRIEELPVAEWHRVIETNVLGTYHGVRAAIPWFREQGRGVLVNVSSVLSKVGAPYQSAYVASKHAVRALSDCARQELLDVPHVHVCSVLPGPIDTPLFAHAGNHVRRRVKPPKPVIDAHRVARAIVGCVRRPRREVAVGGSTMTALGMNRLLPGLTERIAARQVDEDHFTDEPATPTAGNLFVPAEDDGQVSGGWSRAGRLVGANDSGAASTNGHGRPLRTLALAGAAAIVVARARRQ